MVISFSELPETKKRKAVTVLRFYIKIQL